MRQHFTLALPRATLELGKRTVIMGILNVTPDSFSDGGKHFQHENAVARAREMEQEGADIIDVGGESSRPGSNAVPEEEEMRRVLPVVDALSPVLKIPVSIDTYRSGVAKRAVEVGAQIVNDISAFRFDENMPRIVSEARLGVVLMHSRGSRDTLHRQSPMQDVLGEVTESLAGSIERARAAGTASESIVIDPGIGFGKTADESLTVLKSLSIFSRLNYPLLVGTSRKSFIRRITSETEDARNWGTAATIVAGIMNGAHIMRVHDVRQTRVLADITDRLL
jgi:dihydropteroate synthase